MYANQARLHDFATDGFLIPALYFSADPVGYYVNCGSKNSERAY